MTTGERIVANWVKKGGFYHFSWDLRMLSQAIDRAIKRAAKCKKTMTIDERTIAPVITGPQNVRKKASK